jgi:hypothetical protein
MFQRQLENEEREKLNILKAEAISKLDLLDENKVIDFFNSEKWKSLTTNEVFCAVGILKNKSNFSKAFSNNKELMQCISKCSRSQQYDFWSKPEIFLKDGIKVIDTLFSPSMESAVYESKCSLPGR